MFDYELPDTDDDILQPNRQSEASSEAKNNKQDSLGKIHEDILVHFDKLTVFISECYSVIGFLEHKLLSNNSTDVAMIATLDDLFENKASKIYHMHLMKDYLYVNHKIKGFITYSFEQMKEHVLQNKSQNDTERIIDIMDTVVEVIEIKLTVCINKYIESCMNIDIKPDVSLIENGEFEDENDVIANHRKTKYAQHIGDAVNQFSSIDKS